MDMKTVETKTIVQLWKL